MDPPERMPEKVLREHDGFVRAISLALLRDRDEAEDNTQDVWLAALERPPRDDSNRKGWLRTVARRLAWRRRRSTARRFSREAGLTPPASKPAPEDVVERLDTQRRVLDAVRMLPEPYRTTIGLRYLHGLSARQVAELQRIPLETVKTRLTRALAKLREHLGRDVGGDPGSWRRALLPLVWTLPPSPTAAAPATGALLGGVAVKKTLAIAILLLAMLAGGYVLTMSWGVGNHRDPEGESAPRALQATEAPRLLGRRDGDSGTEPVQPGASAASTTTFAMAGGSSLVAAAPPGGEGQVQGGVWRPYRVAEETSDPSRAVLRVVSRGDADESDVTVRVERSAGRETVVLAEEAIPVPGRVEVLALEPGSVAVYVRRGGFERTVFLTLPGGRVTELDAFVPAGREVSGTVRHVLLGALAGVTLVLDRGGVGWRDQIETGTDDAGVYGLMSVPPGSWEVKLRGGAAGWQPRRRDVLVVEACQRPCAPVVHDVVIGRVAVEGTVRDARTGEPLAAVQVGLSGPVSARMRTDAQGHYVATDLDPGAYTLSAAMSGYVPASEKITVEPAAPLVRDFALLASAMLHIRLRDAAGLPVTGFVRMQVQPLGATTIETPIVGLLADGEGRAVCMLLPPGEFDLILEADGREPKTVRSRLQPGDNELQVAMVRSDGSSRLTLVGTVRDAKTGQPVRGVTIRAVRADGLASTDDAGRYALRGLRGEICDLLLMCEGYGYTTIRDVALDPEQTVVRDIDLPPAATLRMHVEDARGSPVTGEVMLTVRPSEGMEGTRFAWAVMPDARGLVISRKIVPGRYAIRLEQEGAGAAELEVLLPEGGADIHVRLE